MPMGGPLDTGDNRQLHYADEAQEYFYHMATLGFKRLGKVYKTGVSWSVGLT